MTTRDWVEVVVLAAGFWLVAVTIVAGLATLWYPYL